MTAHEEQDERVVVRVVEIERRDDEEGLLGGNSGFTIEACAIAAQRVGHATCGDANEPGARTVRSAFVRPLIRCCDQGLLHRVFRDGEVAKAMEQDAEHLRCEVAQQMLGRDVQPIRCHRGEPIQSARGSCP